MKPRAALWVLGVLLTGMGHAQEHGQVREHTSAPPQVWDADLRQWTELEAFWSRFAKAHTGRYWGRSRNYPEYEQVKEFDTFMVEVEQGPCLMEFFHQRWRRANDVRRWDDQMNEVLGCPHVFAES